MVWAGGPPRAEVGSRFFVFRVGNMGDKAVNLVSVLDAMRSANWLHNGQPTVAQDASTTEEEQAAHVDSNVATERLRGGWLGMRISKRRLCEA